MPRHPPCALCILTFWYSLSQHIALYWALLFYFGSHFSMRLDVWLIISDYHCYNVQFSRYITGNVIHYRVEITRFELVTSCLQGRRSPNWAIPPNGIFNIWFILMGLSGLEPPTSRLSGVRSNRLSYKPILFFRIRQPPTLPHRLQCSTIGRLRLNRRVRDGNGCVPWAHRHRKFSYSIPLITQQ